MDIRFDTYHDYDAMTGHLQALAAAYPQLATLTSIGRTHRGRDVWFMQITNPDTGPALEKPGFTSTPRSTPRNTRPRPQHFMRSTTFLRAMAPILK